MGRVMDRGMQRLVGIIFCLVLIGSGAPVRAAEATGKVIKVLPHYLDLKGRQSLSPSLYERDAYQAYLREHPEECSTVRFDVQWKAKRVPVASCRIRVEVRGSEKHTLEPLMIESAVNPRRWGGQWSGIVIPAQEYEMLGSIVAWRVTLWSAGELLGEQQSFLW